MLRSPKTLTLLVSLSLVVICTATTISTGHKYKNLKVLPQDITEREMDSIMGSYSNALKVSCEFCHVPEKKLFNPAGGNNNADFSSDNPMKENARRMIRMNIEINKTYFRYDSITRPEFLNVVSCNTCHRGNPFPMHE